MRPWVLRARPPTLVISKKNRCFSTPTTCPSEFFHPIALHSHEIAPQKYDATLIARCSPLLQRSLLRRSYPAVAHPCARTFPDPKSSRVRSSSKGHSPASPWHYSAAGSRWQQPFISHRSKSAGNARCIPARDRSTRRRTGPKGCDRAAPAFCVCNEPQTIPRTGWTRSDRAVRPAQCRSECERIGARDSSRRSRPRWSGGRVLTRCSATCRDECNAFSRNPSYRPPKETRFPTLSYSRPATP